MRPVFTRITLLSALLTQVAPGVVAQSGSVAPRQIVPPKGVATKAPGNAVVIRPGPSANIIQSLKVKRQIALPSLRSNPVVKLQATNVDFKPVLSNPRALFNVADMLRAAPQLASVRTDDTQIYEVEQGLVVRSLLAYEIKPGVCISASKRAQLASRGVACATRLDPAKRAEAFANPNDPHYVADPTERANAIAAASKHAAETGAAIAIDIADLRARFANPAHKAALVAQLGAAEVARLQGLDDESLKTEMVNSGEVAIEEVMFIPAADKPDTARNRRDNSKTKLPVIKSNKKQLQTTIFLTGFTLGRNYEWRQRVEKSIKWCIAGCKKTYYAEVFAGFNYGFGLRFPIKLDGTYKHTDNGGKSSATVTVNYAPFNGSAQDYAATGLPADKLFEGKEIVAQFGAHAGFGYKIPFYGSSNVDAKVGEDFTKGLEGDYANGQFTPPAPGQSMPPLIKTFSDIDLIAGSANFGVAGAKVFPAVKANLQSDGLGFTLRDNVLGTDTPINATGQTVNLGVEANDQTSSFTIRDPVYNLGFLITPGLVGRIFIDVSVWSHNWDWPVWFPQLSVKLPPDGVDFACHEETVCSRNYLYSPTGAIETAGAKAGENTPFHKELAAWSAAFDAKWLPQCLDKKCKTGIKLVRLNAELEAKQTYDATPANAPKPTSIAAVKPSLDKAEASAATLIQESKDRKANKATTKKAGAGWVLIYKAVWLPRCMDELCKTNVGALIDQMPAAAEAKQKQFPDEGSLQVQAKVGQDFAPKLQKEVDDSKARVRQQRTPDDSGRTVPPTSDPSSRKP